MASSQPDRLVAAQTVGAVSALMPAFRPKGTYAPHVSRSQTTWSLQLSRTAFQVKFTLQRVGHHLRAILPTLAGGLQWWWAQKGIDPQLFRFLTATSIFNFGISIFFLLYNLLLTAPRLPGGFPG